MLSQGMGANSVKECASSDSTERATSVNTFSRRRARLEESEGRSLSDWDVATLLDCSQRHVQTLMKRPDEAVRPAWVLTLEYAREVARMLGVNVSTLRRYTRAIASSTCRATTTWPSSTSITSATRVPSRSRVSGTSKRMPTSNLSRKGTPVQGSGRSTIRLIPR